MNKRSSAPARIFAVIALVVAFIVAIVVLGSVLGGGGSDGSGGGGNGSQAAHHGGEGEHSTPATYTIESGDTLIGIAHRMGVPVARIESLNPQVDPQILIAGEELKLR